MILKINTKQQSTPNSNNFLHHLISKLAFGIKPSLLSYPTFSLGSKFQIQNAIHFITHFQYHNPYSSLQLVYLMS